MKGSPVEAKIRLALTDRFPLLSISGDIEALLGFSAKEFADSSVQLQDRIHPGDADLAAVLFSTAPEHRSGVCNLRLRHADGKIRCIRIQYAKELLPDGGFAVDLLLQDGKSLWTEAARTPLAAYFTAMMENTDDFIFFKDRNHVFTGASRNINAALDPARHGATVQGLTDYDIFPEEFADIYYRLEKQVFATGSPVQDLHLGQTVDGKPAWLDNRKYPIRDGSGAITGLFGVARDITDRMQIIEKLRANEEQLREVHRIAGLGSYLLDVSSGLWTSSEILDAIFGIDKDFERTTAAWISLVHPDDRSMMQAYLTEDILRKGEPFNKEYRIVRHCDGAVRWVHGQGSLDFDSHGQPVRMQGVIWDITQQKLAEAGLSESEESLREAEKIAGIGSYVLDVQAGKWKTSEALREMMGIDDSYDHTRHAWLPLIHPDDREAVFAHYTNDVLGQGMLFEHEYRIVRRTDGAVRWMRGLGRVELDAQGKPAILRGTIQDITERRQAESALRESRDLFELFISNAPVALAMLDREMRYLAVSRHWLEMHGLEGRQMRGLAHYEVVSHISEEWKAQHRRALAGEAVYAGESQLQSPIGKVQWVRRKLCPWFAGDGSVGGIIIFTEDITEQKKAEAALRESRNLFELFIRHAPAALAMFDREMRYLAASRRWLENYNLLEQDVIGRSRYDFPPEPPEHWKEIHRRSIAGESFRSNEDHYTDSSGKSRWLRWETVPWYAADGTVGGILIFAEDITRQREIEERLRLDASVFTHAREGIYITDAAGNILEVNEAFTRITGYTREEVIGRNPRLLQSGLQSKEFYEKLWRSLDQAGQWSGEIWNRAKNGDIFAAMLSITAVRDNTGNIAQYVALFSDITLLKERERQLEHIAHYDVVTGLPNRALLADRLRQAMAQAHRRKQLLAVAYLDLDGFKEINDNHGHAAGDQLLSALATRMKAALREGDTLARLGGDEFVAVLLDLNKPKDSTAIINRLLEAAAEETLIGKAVLRVSASIGVAFYPQSQEVDADQLLRQADQAMYQAKLAGRNNAHIFDPSQDLTVRGRYENVEHIRRALARREFVLYYQPKVNMHTGKVIGAEALLRWQHPERGLLPPGMFLPAIEDHPLFIDIGEWVIDSALAQIEALQAAGLQIPVSVNVGALQLQQSDFVERLSALLAAHPGVSPSSLEIEVLETSALQDVVQASRVLQACHELGVSIALDDFGSGYSSLTYLKHLPANTLKIDRSFVSEMLDDPENLAILEGVLGLASAFRRVAIAEGVETAEHGLLLLRLGCELGQGYGIAHPMPAHDLPGWVASWRPDPRWASAHQVSPDNRPLLFAYVEHRAWFTALEACLQGKRGAVQMPNSDEGRFGSWLEAEHRAGRDSLPTFQAIVALHQHIHALADKIYAACLQGYQAEALSHLSELNVLREQFFEHLTGCQ